MKNIFEIMEEYGVKVPDDKKKDFEKSVLENYKTVSDYAVQSEKLKTAEGKVEMLTSGMKKFEGINVEELNNTIAALKSDLENKDKELHNKLAERDFNDILKDSITAARGRNAKAITALLDIETLRASKNQKEDIAAALKELSEKEDSKMLFREPEPAAAGGGNPIGTVEKGAPQDSDAAMRAVMGLPPVKEQK